MAKSFRIKLKKSLNGSSQSQKDTLRCLGLRKIRQEVLIKDNPANRGQIYKIQHMVEVSVEK